MLIFESIQQAAVVKFHVDLEHFKDLKNLILNILKEKLIVSCLVDSCYLKIVESFLKSAVQAAMINKDTIKFQIKIFLKFYWRAKEVTNIVFLRILVKSFDKPHHLCALHITGYFFCCTMIKIQAC